MRTPSLLLVALAIFVAVPAGAAPSSRSSSSRALVGPGPVTAVWANDGGDKVAKEELRARTGKRAILSQLWDGSAIALFGARNETIGFNLVLEAADGPAADVSVSFPGLNGPNGARIASKATDDPFDWVNRPIELFLVGYLKIHGLSRLTYETYDELHVPERFRLPKDANGKAIGGWTDRPDHDLSYPDIAQPMELTPRFSIGARRSQSVWVDVTIPKLARAGAYTGMIQVKLAGRLAYRVPVRLDVLPFTLPDVPTSKTMVATEYTDVSARYVGEEYPAPGSVRDKLVRTVMDRQFMLAHRHRVALFDDNDGPTRSGQNQPRPEWKRRLDGSLFTAANGYDGPGVGKPNGVFVIGPYGKWQSWWGTPNKAEMQRRLDRWELWFRANAPAVDRMIFLADEFFDVPTVETWASWVRGNPGPGGAIRSLVNIDLVKHGADLPSVDVIGSWLPLGDTPKWDQAVSTLRQDPRKRQSAYNGHRPGSGSFAIEDDGVALRELAWGQWKKGIDIWQVWQSTYYDDYQGVRGPTDLFSTAQTFGGTPRLDPYLGRTSWNYTNGDGVLFYPGMDAVFPKRSRGLAGPMASLRLKLWRRGIQDVDYISRAMRKDPVRTKAIVERMVPTVLWETGVDDPADPTYVHGPIGWSTDPRKWEAARRELADIILGR